MSLAAAETAAGAAAHRRGHSTGSMMAKERDEDLALFHEMKARERNNFLHPSTDDIEASLRYRIVATAPHPKKGPNDLLGLEPEKNDYDWLLTPPGTPLFPSLDQDAPTESQLEAAIRGSSSRSRPNYRPTTRGSSSPRRPTSPGSSTSTGSLTRRASFGNSSPSRGSSSRPITPTGRSTTPGRSSTPTRRTLTTSASFNNARPSTTASTNHGSSVRRSARSSSPSRKPRSPTMVVHPAAMVAGFANEPPPNLRTSMPDRPHSNTRGASVSPRLPGSGSFKTHDHAGEVAGRRRAVSPSLSRSYSSSASSTSKGSVISSHNSGVEVNRPSALRINTDVAGKRPSPGLDQELSPVKPVSKKPVRVVGAVGLAPTSSVKKPFEASSVRQMDFRRSSTSGFRPLMSNSHISSFYTRTSNSLQHHRPSLSIVTDSSINSSSAASVHDSDHEDEVVSKKTDKTDELAASVDGERQLRMITGKHDVEMQDVENESMLSSEETKFLDAVEEMPGAAWTPRSEGTPTMLAVTPTSSDALCSTDFQEEDMEIECSYESPRFDEDCAESVRSLLELVISEAVDVAEAGKNKVKDVQQRYEIEKWKDREVESSTRVLENGKKLESRSSEEQSEDKSVEAVAESVQCFSQLIDPKYSSSSIEVYQFDQELQTTGSEVGSGPGLQNSPVTGNSNTSNNNNNNNNRRRSSSASSRSNSREFLSPSTSGTVLEKKFSSSVSSHDSSTSTHPLKTDMHVARSSRTSKPTLRDPPSFNSRHHSNNNLNSMMHSRKRDSRESSLFSIQISSSKGGESISSGRPTSTDDTHSSIDTPRRFPDGDGSYKAYDEYDTKSEESCVDYYIDSMEPKKYVEEKSLSRELEILPSSTTSAREGGTNNNNRRDCDIMEKDHRFDADDVEDGGFVDYYIDDLSAQQQQQQKNDKRKTASADLSSEKSFATAGEQQSVDIFMEPAEDRTVFVDETQIQVCSMEESSSDSGDRVAAAASATVSTPATTGTVVPSGGGVLGTSGEDEIDTMTECWKQLEEADMDGKLARSRSSLSQNSVESSQGVNTMNASGGDHKNSTSNNSYSLSETRDSILFCSSIVHDIVYRAASLGMEKEDLKALATPASADELVTFLGLSKATTFVDQPKWKAEESTVRRTLAYMQNQKLMQNTTVAYMQQSPVGRVEEDVKDHIIPEHHFIDRSLERKEALLEDRKKSKAKCRCTIL